jgi:hypothetical protein
MEMNTQATKLQAAENDLKQLMADVNRAMEKAREAVARIASKSPDGTAATESTTFVALAKHRGGVSELYARARELSSAVRDNS